MSTVQILMSTYNGGMYIDEQMESLCKQLGVKTSLLIRDDGSTDDTIEKVYKYVSQMGVEIIKGKNKGVINSFFELIKAANLSYDFFALCDQDDVWDYDKLLIATSRLSKYQGVPALYYSSKRIVDENLTVLKENSNEGGKLNFHEVLIGNNATGCTMVFNKVLLEGLKQYVPSDIIMHDHWIYSLCLAMDGVVIFDKEAHISYRQHGRNVIGVRRGVFDIIKNSSLFKKKFRSNTAKQILVNYEQSIPNEKRKILEVHACYYKSIRDKLRLLKMEMGNCQGGKRKIIFLCNVLLGIY